MLNASARSRSDHPQCRLLLFLRCYLALREISSSKQEVVEHVIRHLDVMRQNWRPKTKLGRMKDMHKFQVFADYHQFYLMDASIKPNIPEEVTEQDMLRRLRAAPHIVVFHTESAAHVPVEVVFVSEPTEAEGAWEHQAAFSLSLPSGTAALCGCTDFVPDCPRITTAPGSYSGHAYFAGSTSGDERYCLVLWPATTQQVIPSGLSREARQFGDFKRYGSD